MNLAEHNLRSYQQECIEKILSMPPGSYLIQMATGLGKTYTFSKIPRKGRLLIISHREELVTQPLKYFNCQKGIEQGKYNASPLDEVVSASVQSLSRRLDLFDPNEFDIIVWDEAHHCAAGTYQKIFNYFSPRLNLGFTATPGRSDKVRLDNIFSEIIFSKDLRSGIKEGYLSDIYCRRVNIGYDLSAVKISRGDYAPGELDKAMDGTADAIAQCYKEMAQGATLVFAVSVAHANEIAGRIPGAVVVTAKTKGRSKIIERFTSGEIPCIVNCMVFTEGTDIPRVETIIIARPTQSDSLYAQMVGRGLRLSPGKDKLNLIDCVGITGKANLCTAPSLLGIDLQNIPEKKKEDIEGMIFDLPEKAILASDCPQSWIKNIKIVDLWAKEQKYNTHDVNYFKMPDGSLVCSLPDRKRIVIPCPNELGKVCLGSELVSMQEALDRAYSYLQSNHESTRYIWDLERAKYWGNKPASEKQINLIQRRIKGFNATELNKLEASQILNRIMMGKGVAS